MAVPGTCPRGHELAENAVYCTVCWVRVEPVDPEVVEARRRRQRRIWFPLMGAGALAVGAVVGGALAAGSGDEGASLVAGEPATTASPATGVPAITASPAATAAEQEPASVAAPQAATVARPAVLVLEACVPEDTATVVLKGRSSTDDPWVERDSEVVLGEQGACASGEVAVSVASDTDATRWRLVMLDASGERIGKATVDAPER